MARSCLRRARDMQNEKKIIVSDYDQKKIRIVDKGALDCTIKARIEGAVFRSVDQYDNLPWGGAIK